MVNQLFMALNMLKWRYVEIPLSEPDQTLSLVGCGRVDSKFHYTDPRTLSATRLDQYHGKSPYMWRLSGQVYDQTRSADLSETQG